MESHTGTVTLEELPAFTKELLASLVPTEQATVIALKGDLGAGKTTFVKTLANELGVNEIVTSPTFTIVKSYETTDAGWKLLLHMDAYRIEELPELAPLQFSELLKKSAALYCIEWAENIAEALPVQTIWLHFENSKDEDKRTVRIEGLPVNR